MYIKLKEHGDRYLYLDKIPHTASAYHTLTYGYGKSISSSTEFYYFQKDQLFSYSGFSYKFKSLEDVTKLLEDMMECEASGLVVYDVDAKLVELGISLM